MLPRRAYLIVVAALGLAGCGGHGQPDTQLMLPPAEGGTRELTADQQVMQALNRLTFGARPGDAAHVRQIGVERWIAQQLSPASINDDPTDAFLAHFTTYSQPIDQLMAGYPDRAMVRRQMKADTVGARLALDSLRRARARLGTDVEAARVARAELTTRQLNEVMTDFWENHFNVYARKGGPELYYLSDFDRAVIRPHALGKFRDLLGAVARSPAMLYYLDNWESIADSGRATLAERPRRGLGRVHGLNENYGRELLELHTLGVDGGYSQSDVMAVARALTGWSIQRQDGNGLRAGAFVFRPAVHDAEPKVVLGHTLPAGRGLEDGEEVLDIVAQHPATARFIARKLCVRFVSDSPPPALVDRAAATFTRTDGDIRQVLWTIVTSSEFFSRAAYRSKVKTPFEVVVSATRALDAAPDSTPRTAQVIAGLGEPIFGHQAPNGYSETGDAWINTGAILGRINFGLAVAADRIPGANVERWPVAVQLAAVPRDAQVDGVIAALLGGDASPDTRRILLSGNHPFVPETQAERHDFAQIVGLAIGAPEFQRR
jgi:uncharacterized protein (DUF1800 family)